MTEKIEHSALQGLSRDDHPQYLYLNPDKDTRNVILPCNASISPITMRGALGQKSPLIRILDFQGKDRGEICEDKIKFGAGVFDEVDSKSGKIKNLSSESASIENLSTNSITCKTINKKDLDNEFNTFYNHIRTRDRHLSNEEIEHQRMRGCGSNTHADIDSHISNPNIHFTKNDISHKDIQDRGRIPHKDIDSHIYNKNIHFTKDEISHSDLKDKNLDHHPQYLLTNGNRSQTKLDIEKSLKVGEDIECSELESHSILTNIMKVSKALIENIKTKVIECKDLISNTIKSTSITTNTLLVDEVTINQDLVVSGDINGVDLLKFIERYSRHLKNEDKEEYHNLFTQSKPGFMPPPPYRNYDYQMMDGTGRWKGVGEYLELIIDGGSEFLSNRKSKWSFDNNYITIPFSGVFRLEIDNIDFIMLNDEVVEKSIDYDRMYLSLSKNDILYFWCGDPEQYKPPEKGKIMIQRIDDLGTFE